MLVDGSCHAYVLGTSGYRYHVTEQDDYSSQLQLLRLNWVVLVLPTVFFVLLGFVPSCFNLIYTTNKVQTYPLFWCSSTTHTPAGECRRRSPAAWLSLAGICTPQSGDSFSQGLQHQIAACPPTPETGSSGAQVPKS